MSEAMFPSFFLGLSRAGFGLAIQSTALLALGLLLGAAVRKRGPNAQALVYRGTMVAVACGAVVSLTFAAPLSSRAVISLPQALAGRPLVDTSRLSTHLSPSSDRPLPTARPQSHPLVREEQRRASRFWQGIAIQMTPAALFGQVWAIGCLLMLAWLLACHFGLARLRRRCRPVLDADVNAAIDGLCAGQALRRPELLAGRGIRGPFLAGLLRPAIVLPETYREDFPEPALQAVLAHEMAHLRRRDCWWGLLARIICAFGWMQPLTWLLCNRHELAVEEACDEEVLRYGCPADDYARCLVDLAERLLPIPAARTAAATVIPSRSSLSRRVIGILKRRAGDRTPLPRSFRAGVGIATFAAAAAAVGLVSTSWVPVRSAPKVAKEALVGKVIAKDGKPVKGARVMAFVKEDVPPEGGQKIGPNSFGFAFVDEDGGYRIEGLPDGEAIVCLHDPKDRVAASVRMRVRDGKGTAPDLEIVPAGNIQGRVLDRAGKPMEGISMAVYGPNRPEGVPFQRLIRSDAEGRFSVPVSAGKSALKVLGPVDWAKVGDDAAPPEVEIEVTVDGAETKTADLVADERFYGSGVFVGRVVYPDGKPAAGIKVMAQVNESYYRQEGARIKDEGPFTWAEDVTAADGTYRLTGMMTAAFNVSIEDPKDEWVAAAAENVPAVIRTTFRPVELRLNHGGYVTGVVTDSVTGKPVKGVYVGSYGPHRPNTSAMIISSLTDEKGRYRLHVAPGESRVYIADSRYSQNTVTVTVKEGETRNQDFMVTETEG